MEALLNSYIVTICNSQSSMDVYFISDYVPTIQGQHYICWPRGRVHLDITFSK